jgi:hypothetical protein
MNPQQLQKAIEANKISSDKAIPIILKGLEKDFAGLMDEAVQDSRRGLVELPG